MTPPISLADALRVCARILSDYEDMRERREREHMETLNNG